MNPLDLWVWPWTVTMEAWRRALDVGEAETATTREAEARSFPAGPEWSTANRLTLDIAALRLRDFSVAMDRFPVLVVTPFALHDAQIADLAPGHSLLDTLLRNGCARLYLVEWKSATEATRLHTIDTQLASLNVAVDDIGGAVDLIGLCQGGWLSLVFAARFPGKVRRLVLVGAPIDIEAEPSALTAPASFLSQVYIDELVAHGHGPLLGRDMAALWPRDFDGEKRAFEALQISEPATPEAERRAIEIFNRWDERAFDLPAPYYRQVFDWLFRENRLASGSFPALGRKIDPRDLRCPLFLLAGEQDAITPLAQAFAAANLVHASEIETALALCGHLALFMGRKTLETEWPRIAKWLVQ